VTSACAIFFAFFVFAGFLRLTDGRRFPDGRLKSTAANSASPHLIGAEWQKGIIRLIHYYLGFKRSN
jgi:hypothetical protein